MDKKELAQFKRIAVKIAGKIHDMVEAIKEVEAFKKTCSNFFLMPLL